MEPHQKHGGEIMPDLTPNINLKKPLLNEAANIEVINDNMDKIDSEIAKVRDSAKREHLADLFTNGIIPNALKELKITQTDTPSKAIKIETGKINIDGIVYTFSESTTLNVEPSDALDVTNEPHTSNTSCKLKLTYFPLANQAGDGLATKSDITVTRVSDGSVVNVISINAQTGEVTTDTPNESLQVDYKSFSKRIDIVYLDTYDGTLKVLKGTPVLPTFNPNIPNLKEETFELGKINLSPDFNAVVDNMIKSDYVFYGINGLEDELNEVDLKMGELATKEQVEVIEYNIYQIMLQNYYDRKYLLKKGLFFDGFANTDVIDTSVSTSGLIDTTEKKLSIGGVSPFDINTSELNTVATSCSLGYASLKLAQTFVINEKLDVNSISVYLAKSGNPIDNLKMSIYKTASLKLPTTLIATSTSLVSGSSLRHFNYVDLANSLKYKTFYFPQVSLTPGIYAIVLERTGSMSEENYFNVGRDSNNDREYGGKFLTLYGNDWILANGETQDMVATLNVTPSVNLSNLYQTKEQVFSQNISKATLYIRYKIGGALITPKISISDIDDFKPMILDGKPYAVDVGYEAKYIYKAPIPNNKVKIQLILNVPDYSTEIQVIDYGCILGVS
jgi:hypothetical protein